MLVGGSYLWFIPQPTAFWHLPPIPHETKLIEFTNGMPFAKSYWYFSALILLELCYIWQSHAIYFETFNILLTFCENMKFLNLSDHFFPFPFMISLSLVVLSMLVFPTLCSLQDDSVLSHGFNHHQYPHAYINSCLGQIHVLQASHCLPNISIWMFQTYSIQHIPNLTSSLSLRTRG